MENFYSDAVLNQIANRINDKAYEIMNAINPIKENRTNIEQQILDKYLNNTIELANDFLNSVEVDIQLIKEKTSSNNEIYIKINDAISGIIASHLIRMYCHMTNMALANKQLFKSDSSLVNKTKNDINEALIIMDKLKLMDVSNDGQNNILENYDLLKQLKNRYNKVVNKRKWF